MNLDKSIILFERKESGKIIEIEEVGFSDKKFKYKELASYEIKGMKNRNFILDIDSNAIPEELMVETENFLISELFEVPEYEKVTIKWTNSYM